MSVYVFLVLEILKLELCHATPSRTYDNQVRFNVHKKVCLIWTHFIDCKSIITKYVNKTSNCCR